MIPIAKAYLMSSPLGAEPGYRPAGYGRERGYLVGLGGRFLPALVLEIMK